MMTLVNDNPEHEGKEIPTWEYVSGVAEEFRVKFGGVHSYIAAAIEHDHRELKPVKTEPATQTFKNEIKK